MKKLILTTAIVAFCFLGLSNCNQKSGGGSVEIENTDLVPSGTYMGIAKEVDPEEKEIYVETEDGKTLELYFTDQTQVTKNGQTATFDDLVEDGKVEVTIEKKGKRLEPMEVKIIE